MPFYHSYSYKKLSFLFFLLCPFFSTAVTFSEADSFVVTVVDAVENPMVAVTIFSVEKGFATSTDKSGKANIVGLEGQDSLVFTHLGYVSKTLTVEDLSQQSYRVQLELQSLEFEAIIVKGAFRTEEYQSNIPSRVDVIDHKELSFINPQTTADALLNTGNVFVQKSQMGGGSPVIRGFEANKVLIVIDGVRMNNAIYRNGHLQNSITVDNNMLERVEVIYGPAAVIYGSDALGGVMSFTSKQPRLALGTNDYSLLEGNAFIRFSTANQEKTGHLDFNFGNTKWSSLTSMTVSSFDDLRTGSANRPEYPDYGKRFFYVDRINGQDSVVQNENPLIQVGTAYSQLDLTQKLLFKPRKDWRFLANIQYSNTTNVPRYDQLTQSTVAVIDGNRTEDFRFSEWYYGPQKRFLSAITSEFEPNNNKAFDHLAVILAYQHIEEDRISRRFGSVSRTNQEETVHVGSLNIDFVKRFQKEENAMPNNQKQRLRYGLELNYNAVKSLAYHEDIETGELNFDAVTRYPDGGSQMTTAAAYTSFRQKIGDQYTLNAGLRYTFAALHAEYADTTKIQLPYTEISSNLGALTGSVAMIWKVTPNTNINAIASTAFRSPNVDDFGKIRAKGDFVLVPNPNLSSEYALNGELSITQHFNFKAQAQQSTASVTGFYTYLFDAIVRDFTTLNGVDSLLHFGDYYTTQWNVNAGTAYIYGLSANIDLAFGQSWNLKSSFNYIKGWNTFDNAPLAHIPPIYGQTSLNYSRKQFKFRFLIRYNGWKQAEDFDWAGTDNLELTTVDGTPSWYTLNTYATYQLTKNIMTTLAFENILDAHYRPFSSGVSAAGRNIIISLRKHF